MRSKSGGSRARLSKLPSPSPATGSLPFISIDSGKLYGECSRDRTLDRMSREKNEGAQCYNDAGASRYGKNEVDMSAEDYDDLDSSLDFLDSDSDLELKTCVLCLKSGCGDILLCSAIGCPVAVHKKCLITLLPEFDDLEKFYCPYCVYKYTEQMKEKSRNKTRVLKKHLSDFLDFTPSGGDNVRMNERRGRGQESNVLASGGERNCSDCGGRMVTNQVENRFVLVESEKQSNQVENRFLLVESGQQNDEDNAKMGDLFAKSRTVVEHLRDSLAPISCLGNERSHSQEKLPGIEVLVDNVIKEQFNGQNVTVNQEPEMSEDRGHVDVGGHEIIEEENIEKENVVDGSHHPSKMGVTNTSKPKRTREEEGRHPESSGTENFDSDTETISMRQKHLLRSGKKKAQAQNVEALVDNVSKEQFNEQNVTVNQEPEISEDRGQVDVGGHEIIEEENVEKENVVDGSHHPSKMGVSNTSKPKRRREEEGSHPESSRTENFDSDTETISTRQKRLLRSGKKKAQAQNVDSVKKFSFPEGANSEKITISPNVKVTDPKKSRKQQASTTMFTNLPFASEKRKRKDWKTEEEEMLREAVHKFSSTVNKNLPWRKMLEFGRHVFDPTRTPVDLKDKWRNMKAKESSSTSRK